MKLVAFEILFILLLVLANGIFAMSEMAVVAARKTRLRQLADRGDAKARAALEMAHAPESFLSTIQIGITLVGILAGALGGGTIAGQLAFQMSRVPLLAPYSEALSLGMVVLGITYLALILGELVPKRLALNSPERIAAAVAPSMRTLSRIASPVVRLLGASTTLVLRALGAGRAAEHPVTAEEVKILIEEGTRAGMFEEAEQDMVERVFRLGDRRVSALMTPRLETIWLDANDSSHELRRKISGSVHSWFPVSEGSLDNVLGVVRAKELLTDCIGGQPIELRKASRRPLFVPESMGALKVLELFKQTGTHVALVIDEFGNVEGLVTLNDILEAIVGDMPSAGVPAEPQVVRREDGSWLLDGRLPIDEFRDLFGNREMPEHEKDNYQTLAGFVLTRLGRIPSAADHFEWNGLRFEVMDMDDNRVDKVLVARVRPDHSNLKSRVRSALKSRHLREKEALALPRLASSPPSHSQAGSSRGNGARIDE